MLSVPISGRFVLSCPVPSKDQILFLAKGCNPESKSEIFLKCLTIFFVSSIGVHLLERKNFDLVSVTATYTSQPWNGKKLKKSKLEDNTKYKK